jgi:4-amino-4-deoxy-L-arabinose transferase-like glycosyltransferase
VAAGVVVLLTGLIAREFGGGRAAQLLAGGCMAVSAILLAVGHLLSTTTLDLLVWTALSWLLVRALRDGGPVWLAAGAVAGVGLENKLQPAFLLAAVVAGVLLVGPRAGLRSRWPWLGGLVALALWAPNLVWQAAHGWPQLELASAIAAGSSGTSEPWYLFVPFQLVLVSPALVPVWITVTVRSAVTRESLSNCFDTGRTVGLCVWAKTGMAKPTLTTASTATPDFRKSLRTTAPSSSTDSQLSKN